MSLLKLNKTTLVAFVVAIFSIPSVFSLLKPGFFTTDDGGWMIIRFGAFYASFADGQFPVRFLKGLNFGYGYPVANFLYPGFMYVATPFHLLGFGLVDTVKIICIGSLICSAVFTFLWLRTYFSYLSSFVGAIVYVYTPYHLYDIYKRGSVGEVLALTFVPFALYAVKRNNFWMLSISIFLLMISHNTMALVFVPVVILYSLFYKKTLRQNTFGFVTGILLSSFFIIPAVFELGFTYFRNTEISNPLEYFVGLDLIGASSVFIVIVSLLIFVVLFLKKKTKLHTKMFLFFLIISFLSIFLSLPVSSFLWKTPIAMLFQFPFRVLSLLILSSAFLAAYSLDLLKNTGKYLVAFAILATAAYSSWSYLTPHEFTNIPDSVYATNPATTTVKNEYMPIWVKKIPTEQYKSKVEMLNGTGQAENLVEKSNEVSFDLIGNTATKIRINTLYYPGWHLYINDSEVPINYDNPKGAIDASVNGGSKKIRLLFSETPLRLFADTLSVLAVFVMIFYSFQKLVRFKK